MSRIPAMIEALEAGKSVYLATCTRITEITPKTWQRWQAKGLKLLHADSNGHDYMASGKRFVCIDYCKITIF